MVKLFLDKGAQINQKVFNGMTALHIASRFNLLEIVEMLMERGADMNVFDDNGKTPLTGTSFNNTLYFMVKKFAKLKFENQFICEENLEFLEWHHFDHFLPCQIELQRMKSYNLYNDFTVYDLYNHKNWKTLIAITRREDFLKKLKDSMKLKLFDHYDFDLQNIYKEAVRRRNLIESEATKINLVFKDYLPVIVIRKIVYYVNEDLYF